MVLHIFNKQEKFSVKYFKFLKDYGLELSNHKLFHYGKSISYYKERIPELETHFCKSFLTIHPHLWLYKEMKMADKIIIHSLASPILLLFLLIKKEFAEKAYWIIWGKDLYFYQGVKRYNIVMWIYEIFRRVVIKRIGHIVTNIDGDYELAVKWYGATGVRENMTQMMYAYSVNVDLDEKQEKKENPEYLHIILGNSASKTNQHLIALEKLKNVDDGKIKIISPLSYGGNKSYIKQVVKKGKALFGDRFTPILEFMEYKEYMNMLNMMDIGFFFHNRQEALDSIVSLIAKGKTIYMRSDITSWEYFKKNGIVLKDSLMKEEGLEILPEDIRCNNKKNISSIHDMELTFAQWEKILN